MEVLVINDCSTDALTLTVLDRVGKHSGVVVVNHKSNRGLMQARMTGIRRAQGKYITHVDSDDYLTPGIYKKALGKMINEKADILQFGYAESDGGVLKKKLCGKSYQVNSAREAWVRFLRLDGVSNSMWNKIYRSDIPKTTVEYLPLTNRKAEDLVQNILNFSMCNKFIHIGQLGYIYLVREGSGDRIMENSHVLERARAFVHIVHSMQGVKLKYIAGGDLSSAISFRGELVVARFREQINNMLETCTGDQRKEMLDILVGLPSELSSKLLN